MRPSSSARSAAAPDLRQPSFARALLRWLFTVLSLM